MSGSTATTTSRIGTLATKLAIPEYRLRRLINQRLGYRNFNVFLNNHRIEEAKAALADPSQAEVPVITIAMDAGFQSLGPFNRAFKATTGVTPTEYRRLNAARRPDRMPCNYLGNFEIGEALQISARPISKSGERVRRLRHRLSGTRSCVMPENAMTRRRLILILAATTALAALALTAARARDVPKVATGFVANVLCTETFVSGLDPEQMFSETTAAMPGVDLISWAIDYQRRSRAQGVMVTLLGLGRSRAVYREGLGCYLDHGDAVADIALPPTETSRSRHCCPKSRAVARRAADPAACRRARSRLRRTRQRRRSAAPKRSWWSRTATSSPSATPRAIGIDTPILGFSATKSVISALIGILVRKGKLALRPAGAGRGVARRPAIRASDHRRSSVAPHRGPCARQFAAGLARVRASSRSTA